MSYQRPRSEDPRPRGEWARDTRPPVPLPPPKSCDCQFHIFGEPSKYPLHNDATSCQPQASFADMQRVLRVLGIDRGVIVHSQRYDTDHSLLIDTLESLSPEERRNFRATCIIKDNVSDREMEHLNALGICGARFNIGK